MVHGCRRRTEWGRYEVGHGQSGAVKDVGWFLRSDFLFFVLTGSVGWN